MCQFLILTIIPHSVDCCWEGRTTLKSENLLIIPCFFCSFSFFVIHSFSPPAMAFSSPPLFCSSLSFLSLVSTMLLWYSPSSVFIYPLSSFLLSPLNLHLFLFPVLIFFLLAPPFCCLVSSLLLSSFLLIIICLSVDSCVSGIFFPRFLPSVLSLSHVLVSVQCWSALLLWSCFLPFLSLPALYFLFQSSSVPVFLFLFFCHSPLLSYVLFSSRFLVLFSCPLFTPFLAVFFSFSLPMLRAAFLWLFLITCSSFLFLSKTRFWVPAHPCATVPHLTHVLL